MTDVVPVAHTEPATDRPLPVAIIDRLPAFVELAQLIQRTDVVPKAMQGHPDRILASLLMGAELGLQPIQSLRSVNIIDGKPVLAAEAMRALVLAAGHHIKIVEHTAERASVAGCRSNGTEWSPPFTWDQEKATQAGLTGKDNWRKYPSSMLLARATTDLCRALFPDVLAGLRTEEELDPPATVPPQLAPAPGSAPAEQGPAPDEGQHDPKLAREIHATIGDEWPGASADTRARYRHAMAAIVSRHRTEPVMSSAQLTAREQGRLLSLLESINLGEAELVDNEETVMVTRGERWWAVIFGPEPLVWWGHGEETEDSRTLKLADDGR